MNITVHFLFYFSSYLDTESDFSHVKSFLDGPPLVGPPLEPGLFVCLSPVCL